MELPIFWRSKYKSQWSYPEEHITVWRPSNLFYLPAHLTAICPFLHFLQIWYFKRLFFHIITSINLENSIIFSFDHRFNFLFDHNLFKKTIYICHDDFSVFTRTTFLARHVLTQMQTSAKLADICLAVSDNLARKLDVGDKAQVFLPGHDLPITNAPDVRPYRPGDRIRVGFMGYLDKRLGMEWIKSVGLQPDMEWHMIGPITDRETGECLSRIRGVHLYDPLVGAELLEWLHEMDVLTMPYVLPSEWSQTVSTPNKMFAYLAAGKPIVVSNLPHITDWGDCTVYVSHDPLEFVTQIRRARLDDSNARCAYRVDIARQYTWDARIEVLLSLIDD